MLNAEEKATVRSCIHSEVLEIMQGVQKSKKIGTPDAELIDQAVNMSVNRFTVESKMLITSVYSMMSKRTLATPFFQKSENQVAICQSSCGRNSTILCRSISTIRKRRNRFMPTREPGLWQPQAVW